jgi:hypothetical protein
MRKIALLAASAVTATLVISGCSTAAPTTAPLPSQSVPAEPAAEETPADPAKEAHALTGTAKLGETATVAMSAVGRDVSSEYAAPGNEPFARFTVTLKNTGTKALDPNDVMVSCAYGKEGHTSEMVFDTDKGVGDMPSVKVLPGKSATFTQGCSLPKSERALQIQVESVWGGGTVIFQGNLA